MSRVFRALERVEAERAGGEFAHADRSYVVALGATAEGSVARGDSVLPGEVAGARGDRGGPKRRPEMESQDNEGIEPRIEDGQGVLGAVQRLCDEHERLRAAASAAERECAKLRDEVTALRGQVDAFRRERSQIAQAVTDRLNGVIADVPPRRSGPPREPIAARPAQGAPPVSEHPARLSAFSRT